ncbi:Peptidase_C78 domain-containing protein [Cephalotus follicularis]|uniref:Peptidase_C78 domain-containing protein n=1 Tax=Cephalotus follicularis TaxID=3775 RepID=A0A1Q3BMK2_CEPFO|nr:Peptidase_C78 domain-containing protein [Cephalotus follicularis]
MMDSSSPTCCPFCHLTVPSSQLQRHANSHFDDDDDYDQYYYSVLQLANDMELFQQIASSSSSSTRQNSQSNNFIVFPEKSQTTSTASPSASGDLHFNEKISCLIGLQVRATFHHVKDGFIPLLRSCLELEPDNSFSILSGHVDHFQSIVSEDVGWGCGWRNVQMLSSHLLSQRPEARDVLFGGSGFVPDIPSLQRWLEITWERGFDVLGSHHFNRNIYGSCNKIGTTECAALLRSFGLFARIVDFGPKELQSLYFSVPGTSLGAHNTRGMRNPVQVRGPMDKYMLKTNHNVDQLGSNQQEKLRNTSNNIGDSFTSTVTDKLTNNVTRKCKSHQVLIDWVWNYFSDKITTNSGHRVVIVSDKAPLYFQHDGHSRTIIGIQVKHQQNGMQQYSLLILDPGHRTAALERSLKENTGWQKLIKRGVHTLKKPQYQLCYIDPGIASMEEMEHLKEIDSTFIEF